MKKPQSSKKASEKSFLNDNVWLPYTQMKIAPKQLEVESTKGVKIHLKDGRKLIDGVSSWWSVAHGYNHPYIEKAIAKQLKTLPHVMLAGLASEPTYKLASAIAKVTPGNLNKVFFSDSGSTAVEVALKIAVQFFVNRDSAKLKNERTKFIAFKDGYHGDTAGAMSLTDSMRGFHRKFHNYLNRNYYIKVPKTQKDLKDFEDFVRRHQFKAAGVIIEPLIQCAGGMKFHSPEILKEIYQITKKYDLLFIADECATGFFRTGKYFACNHADITPDIMVLGKALTGGFMTLAATVVREEIYNQFLGDDLASALIHGPTFMGNALACASANASLELFAKEDYSQKVSKISRILKTNLEKCRKFNIVKDVRILGAIGVVEVDLNWQEIFELRKDFLKEGIWLRPFLGVIYVMPPLIIKEAELTKITDTIFKLLAKF
jgi:adenosylmethionine-8-amino-7-oxononanoate aminotransferase